MHRDLPLGLLDDIYQWATQFGDRIDETEEMLTDNRIWINRSQERRHRVGRRERINSASRASCSAGSGVPWDIRKSQPYDAYDQRRVRRARAASTATATTATCAAWRSSASRCASSTSASTRCPPAPSASRTTRSSPPPRTAMKENMEALIHHFLLFTKGYAVPPATRTRPSRPPRARWASHVVSDGSERPYRVHIRAPGFAHLAGFDHISRGHMLADAVAIIGTMDLVFGKCRKETQNTAVFFWGILKPERHESSR